MRKRIGEFLVGKGILSEERVTQILSYGKEHGLRFGEAGIEAGLLTREQLISVLGRNYTVDYFHLEPGLYPQITRDLLPVEMLTRLGLLPLGFKIERRFLRKSRKILNLGLLDPGQLSGAQEALLAARSKLGADGPHEFKVFLILPEPFVAVLSDIYGITAPVSSSTHSKT